MSWAGDTAPRARKERRRVGGHLDAAPARLGPAGSWSPSQAILPRRRSTKCPSERRSPQPAYKLAPKRRDPRRNVEGGHGAVPRKWKERANQGGAAPGETAPRRHSPLELGPWHRDRQGEF